MNFNRLLKSIFPWWDHVRSADKQHTVQSFSAAETADEAHRKQHSIAHSTRLSDALHTEQNWQCAKEDGDVCSAIIVVTTATL